MFRRVGIGLAVGGGVVLIASAARIFLLRQRSIPLQLHISLAVVSGMLAGAVTSCREATAEQKKETDIKKVPRRILFGSSSSVRSGNFNLNFRVEEKQLFPKRKD